jgi:hypothetical protein
MPRDRNDEADPQPQQPPYHQLHHQQDQQDLHHPHPHQYDCDHDDGDNNDLHSQASKSPDFNSDINIERIASSSSYDPVTDKGKRPLRSMTDVYEGWGETPSSPRSPTRPASVRRRQSMQHLQELEARVDQLISENRLLAAAKDEAEQRLARVGVARRKSDQTLRTRDADLRDKESEISHLTSSLEWLQSEVRRLTSENENLTAEKEQEQKAFSQEAIRAQINAALADRDVHLRALRDELAAARQTVQELQQQIVAAASDDVLVMRDEDFFELECQRLCQHVQQWVLRFSKNSDRRRCRSMRELEDHSRDAALRVARVMLDGSDVNIALGDRVGRRDVFVAVLMGLVSEYIFTRYLFGMDREHRQKLKTLQKQLTEIGPPRAVAHWRALTLTLLTQRPAFTQQRTRDTEAVAVEVFGTLSAILPPPPAVEATLLESLRGVLRKAADLAIEMRTQRAEYVMLPPLQPEADLVRFNAALMNERSGATTSNEALEARGAVVRLVLFPPVIKRGNDMGEGDDKVVVCPAQVLVAGDHERERPEKEFDHDRMSLDPRRSVASVAPSLDMSTMI